MNISKENQEVFKNTQYARDQSNCIDYYIEDTPMVKCDNCGDWYNSEDFPTEICFKCYEFWKTEEKQSLLKRLINVFKGDVSNETK